MATVLQKAERVIKSGLGIPVFMILMILMIILQIPPRVLDALFTFNIALSFLIMLAVVYARKSLDFSIFPTILLIATLLRLALNIASTRVVLLNGHTGSAAAGYVIQSFGEVVIGGNYTVGIVVFAILVIINFVVITKGGSRISEVSARFTLDAMPGKQMGIDSDLASGAITQEDAKARRAEIEAEADFYGAMDGASKFVRGDAIAGLLILIVNIVGGVLIGVFNHGMPFSEAMRVYAILTIGDGLVAQVPALLLSTSAAVMVTRVNREADMAEMVITQLFSNPKALYIAMALLIFLGILPEMPHFAFVSFGLLIGVYAYRVEQKNERESAVKLQQKKEGPAAEADEELIWDDVTPVDLFGIELGYKLIGLVGTRSDNLLLSRIRSVRKKLTKQLGFLIPPVNIRDNLNLPPEHYQLKLMGVKIGEGSVKMNAFMAIDSGHLLGTVEGVKVKDPAFGLDALWIAAGQKEYALSLGYTVVDPVTVIATHVSHLLVVHAADLFGHQEAEKLLGQLKKTDPKLVEILISPGGLSHRVIVNVMKKLLKSRIPLVDIRTIVSALIEGSAITQDSMQLTELVRAALKRLIYQEINGSEDVLDVMTLDPRLEQILQESIHKDQSGELSLALEPSIAERVFTDVINATKKRLAAGKNAVLVVPVNLRPVLESIFQNNVPELRILSHKEIPDHCQIQIVAVVGREVKEEVIA